MVRVVTDSVSDLPEGIVRRLNIALVPLLVRFGTEEFRDNVDLTPAQFYERLRRSEELPTTSMSSPGAHAETYDRLAGEADAIIVITISAKLSGTYDVARRARELMKRECRVEVFDSGLATMAEGFVAMKAAEAAETGASLQEVVRVAETARSRVDFLSTFDTLEYLRRGGRIGAASALLGSVLKINPLINIRDGLVEPAGRTRSRSKAIDRLVEFVASYSSIEELAVEHGGCPEDAETLVEKLADLYPRNRILKSEVTPVIGAHTGPGLLLAAVLGDR